MSAPAKTTILADDMSVVIDPRGGGLHRPRDIDRGEGALTRQKAMDRQANDRATNVEADDFLPVIDPPGFGTAAGWLNESRELAFAQEKADCSASCQSFVNAVAVACDTCHYR